jgi:hypothetical protein
VAAALKIKKEHKYFDGMEKTLILRTEIDISPM